MTNLVEGKHTCSKCKKEYSLAEFTSNKYQCKYCTSASSRAWREKNKGRRREYMREYHKVWTLKNKDDPEFRRKQAIRQAESAKRHPEKVKTRQKLRNAVADGKINRPSTCDWCNTEAKAEAHHYDYTRPFNVLWLCRDCHETIHHRTVGEYSAII